MPPANQDEEKNAAYWLVRQEEGPLSPPESEDYARWLAADPHRVAEIAAMRATLEDPALMAAMARFTPAIRPRRNEVLGRRALLGGGIAAGLTLAIGTPLLLRYRPAGTAPATLAVPAGAVQRLDLADGSGLVLNGGTTLVTALDQPTRQARLVGGEAFIRIAAAEGAPFTLDCARLRLESAVGAVNVDMVSGLTEISVYEGTATLTDGGTRLLLKPGQRARLEGGHLGTPMPFDPLAGDFRNGWLVTPGLTLGQLAERLNRTATRPIRVADRHLAARRVAGRFRVQETEKLLAALGRLHGFAVDQDEGGFTLRRA